MSRAEARPGGRRRPKQSSAAADGSVPKEHYHHGNLREALLAATLDLVAREGVAGFSLNAAARAAGVSTAAPYRHFASKEALLAEALDRGFADLRKQFVAVAHDHPDEPLDRLAALGVTYVEFAVARPAWFRLLFRDGGPAPGLGATASVAAITGCVEQARRQGQLRAGLVDSDVVRAAWSLVHGLAILHVDRVSETTDLPALDRASIESTIGLVTDGLRRG